MRARVSFVAAVFTAASIVVAVPAGPVGAAPAVNPQCPAGGVKVVATSSPATVTVTDTRTGNPVPVVVTITGTSFAITPADTTLTLTGAAWCVKAGKEAVTGTGLTGVSTSVNKQGVVQPIGYVTIASVTTQEPVTDPWVAARGTCWSGTLPGTGVYDPGAGDLKLTAAPNVWGNAYRYLHSSGGQCSNGGFDSTVVQATSSEAAAAMCAPIWGAAVLVSDFWTGTAIPADAWLCMQT